MRLIASTIAAFAVTTASGDVLAWGASSHGGAFDASNLDVVQLASNARAFAAVLRDGSVIGWGGTDAGGSVSGIVATKHIQFIVANKYAFAAISDDNNVFTYGNVEYGGGQVYNYHAVEVASNDGAFLVLDESSELHTIGFNSSHGSGDSFPDKLDGSTVRMIQGTETFRNLATYDAADSSSSSFPSCPHCFQRIPRRFLPLLFPHAFPHPSRQHPQQLIPQRSRLQCPHPFPRLFQLLHRLAATDISTRTGLPIVSAKPVRM